MPRLELKSKIEKVLYVKLKAGDDVLQAIWDTAKKYNIKAGVVVQGSGGVLKNVVVKGFPRNPLTCQLPLDAYEIEGPFMADIRGLIGVTVKSDVDISEIPLRNAPITKEPGLLETEIDKWQMLGSQGGVNTPYFHGAFTYANGHISHAGFLMPGTQVADLDSDVGIPAGYTLVIAKIKDIEIHAKLGKKGFYHDLVAKQQ